MSIKIMDIKNYYKTHFDIDDKVLSIADEAESEISNQIMEANKTAEYNQLKVLAAMQKNKLSDIHFAATTGYGYNDAGRDVLESIYADVFNTEAALVRPQIISGTHALTVALFGNLKHGDELVSVTGKPYDTLEKVIGIKKTKASLIDNGIIYKQAELTPDGEIDYNAISRLVTGKTKMAAIQRSKGYGWRRSFTVEEIQKLIGFIKSIDSRIICMVDNCYGEFVDIIEPTDVGADMAVGSLIKNPGGGLAPVGGYIAGKEEYVDNAAYRLTSPGLGREVGPSLGVSASFMQGFFLAPQVVSGSIKGALLAARIFEKLGFEVLPSSGEKRSDIVQAIKMKNEENILAFCRGIQKAAPVDSHVTPVPWEMPGYGCPVVMAAGAFVQGSSIELSADAPIKEPYAVYFQGGLTWQHAKAGIIIAVNNMFREGVIDL